MGLRLGRPRAHQHIRADGQPVRYRECARQQFRLIVATLFPSAGMQRDRNDHVGGMDVGLKRRAHEWREAFGHTPLAAKLERQDCGSNSDRIGGGHPYPVEILWATTIGAIRAEAGWRIGRPTNRLAAAGASQLSRRLYAAQAARADRRADTLADDTTWWKNQIQQAAQPRHGTHSNSPKCDTGHTFIRRERPAFQHVAAA